MTDKTTKLTLAGRLCAILADCEAIEKKGFNSFHNYKFLREADVADVIRKLMAKHGVMCLPSTEEIAEREHVSNAGKKSYFIRVKVRYTFLNADNPEEKYEVTAYGDGIDGEDKGLYKALTGCHKYMLLRTFCLGADEDPENDQAGHQQAQPVRQAPPVQTLNLTAADDLPPNYHGFQYDEDAGSTVAYRIPYEQKDRWKDALKAAGHRWNSQAKCWSGGGVITGLEAYQVQV